MSYKKLRTTDLAENRKSEIIGAAVKLFAEEGYHSTTLDKVAADIGVSKATLYYYFRNKEEIIRAILNRSLDRMKQTLEIKKASLSTTEKLRQFIEYHVVFGADDAELAKITFEQLNILPKRSREVLKRKQREIVDFLQDLLQQGNNEGTIKVSNTKIAAFAIIGMCNWTYHWYKPEGKLTPQQISELYVNLIENGYLAKTLPPDKEKKK
jgi:TetR/AcrR family transcriptional regulator, cholesterol catabolism regulator